MAIDSHGNVDVVWLDDSAGTAAVFFSRSSDGGQTFSAPLNISNHQGSPAESERVAVDSTGGIYVVWSEDASGAHTIFFTRSTDNGVSFSAPEVVSENSMGTDPAIAIDASGGVNLLWIDNSDDQRTIFFSRSTDQGRTFSVPLNVSMSGIDDGTPQLTTDNSGNAYIVWKRQDKRDKTTVFFSRAAIASFPSLTLHPANPSDNGFDIGTSPQPTSQVPAINPARSGSERGLKLETEIQALPPRRVNVSSAAKSDPTAIQKANSDVNSLQSETNAVHSAQEGTLYVDCIHYSCAPDISAGINAAIEELPPCGVYPHCGTIDLPSGSYTAATTIRVTSPFIYIRGQGSNVTNISYTPATGYFSIWHPLPFNSDPSQRVSGGFWDLSLYSNANGIQVTNQVGFQLHDVTFNSNSSPGTVCLDEEANSDGNNENWNVNDVSFRACAADWVMNGQSGMPTFGYANISVYLEGGGPALRMAGINFQNSIAQFVVEGATTAISVSNSGINDNLLQIDIESAKTGILLTRGSVWRGNTQNVGIGGTTTPFDVDTSSCFDGNAGQTLWFSGTNSITGTFDPSNGAPSVSGQQLISTGNSIIVGGQTLTAPRNSGTLAASDDSLTPGGALVCTDSNDLLTTSGCGNRSNVGILVGGSCRTPAHAFASCTSTINLSQAEPNTNYAASCTGVGPLGWPYVMGIVSKTISSITIQIGNGSGPAALPSSFSEIDCTITDQ